MINDLYLPSPPLYTQGTDSGDSISKNSLFPPPESESSLWSDFGASRSSSDEGTSSSDNSLPPPTTGNFRPLDHAKLSPSSFDPLNFSTTFVVPRFAAPVAEFLQPTPPQEEQWSEKPYPSITFPYSKPRRNMIPHQPHTKRFSPYASPYPSPVYDLYGSSVVQVISSTQDAAIPATLPRNSPSSSHSPPAFDPVALGLPAPPSKEGGTKNVTGLYSSSGFDMIGVLARVAARVNPQILIGPVDLSCSFLVVDAKKFDMPIVYASETFSKLTGYPNNEIIGRNCRFLQSPDGNVPAGSRRLYSDSNAAHHMKTHIQLGRESQSSLINYRKDGSPFINLVTLIPIVWDDASIAYYVGFQVDLVDQPSAILEKMKNGTYVVNYSLINSTVLTPAPAPSFVSTEDAWMQDEPLDMQEIEPTRLNLPEQPAVDATRIIEALGTKANVPIGDEISRKFFNRMLLDQCDDFVHVLSLKGSLLYVSPSAARLLEYDPAELVGSSLSSVCHPSDIVSVLRELKEAGAISQPTISLLYRIRRKNSGYMWLEASGKLHFEQGKGRKCVILIGRPREVYNASWAGLDRVGALGSSEYWSKQYWAKLSLDGMHLYTTHDVHRVLGFSPAELVGTSLAQLTPELELPAVNHALRQAASGVAITLRHTLRARTGLLQVVTNFHPSCAPAKDSASGSRIFTILAQTIVYSEEAQRKAHDRSETRNAASWIQSNPSTLTVSLDASLTQRAGSVRSNSSSVPQLTGGSSRSTHSSSTDHAHAGSFKSMAHPSTLSDNVFDELQTTKGTSWQYEVASIRLENQALRKEKEKLIAARAQKRAYEQQKLQQQMMNINTQASIASAAAATAAHQQQGCANCGRSDTSMPGPTGRDSLCEMCGTRWSKSVEQQQRAAYLQQHQQHQLQPGSNNSVFPSPPIHQIPLQNYSSTQYPVQYPYMSSAPA